MTPELYQQVKSAFRLALEFPPEQRESFLRQFCAGNTSILTQVLALLASDAVPDTPLDKPVVGSSFRLRMLALACTATRH